MTEGKKTLSAQVMNDTFVNVQKLKYKLFWAQQVELYCFKETSVKLIYYYKSVLEFKPSKPTR